MSRVCSECGKSQVSGNNVSHSHIKTRRVWKANIHKVKEIAPNGEVKYIYLCTRCLRTRKKQQADA